MLEPSTTDMKSPKKLSFHLKSEKVLSAFRIPTALIHSIWLLDLVTEPAITRDYDTGEGERNISLVGKDMLNCNQTG